ncbi:UDP-N-acetylglucosamine 4,6-dehydratase (inverting) [Rickettsiales bacterium]|nr:UDP-N-acetylglucosamine 4,6-dehydratase (inverting) [Rickettsiales bacterium]
MKNKYYKSKINFKNKNILLTGGTGSFGQAFAEKLLKFYDPNKIVILSRDEHKQYEMENKFQNYKLDKLRFFLGDVRDTERLKVAFKDIDYVIHTAALKHVPLAEYNPFECIKTNVIGAQNVVEASIFCGVKKVIALSTDKASNPLNLYGASKLASDKIFIAANNYSGKGGTSFSICRYGNVVNSRGSVIPLFKKLFEEKAKSIPITDRRMSRFWININKGVEFVIASIDMMIGGEIFVPKLPSMNVVDVAEIIAPKIPIKIIGIRSGEKIHETMVSEDDSRYTIELKDRFIILPPKLYLKKEEIFKKNSQNLDLEDNFKYSSDTNTDWLTRNQFLELLKD